ncbi:hypothetical protein BDZ90DRAFT_282297 [Jaminaea rosea]|uniref:Signal recognition particle subunit SRP14 n=1 Tax=Jaminaea rosea TaxID=1569628 RepID=A0A316UHE0_9BASI|nr:hypothetical protein BDZ90DRAFT_282297 [Jaminaea rosea]PWN24659.1 hypothetical protein BDZ90DRAFT_282297 [Jaminaea rosea]
MTRVSSEEFLTGLDQLFTQATSSGSVYLSSKRASHPNDARVPDDDGDVDMATTVSSAGPSSSSSYSLIFRATNGKSTSRTKLSVLIPSSSLAAFQEKLQPLLRNHLSSSLRKRDKAKERRVDKDLSLRRKKDEELGGWKGVGKLGSKRGKGHRKRQRAMKRAMKLKGEEGRERKRREATAAAGGGGGEGEATPSQPGQATPTATSASQAAATAAAATPVAGAGGGGGAGAGNKKKKKGKK